MPTAGVDSAAWVVERFFDRDSFPERGAYLTGEMAAHYRGAATLGAGLPARVVVTPRLLARDSTHAVYAVAMRDSVHARDWYLFLVRERGTWKLDAVRTLALPPLYFMALDASIAGRGATNGVPDSLVADTAAMRLTVRSDSALRAHFAAHAAGFAALARAFEAQPDLQLATSTGRLEPRTATAAADFAGALRALAATVVYRDGAHPGCVFVGIGGMLDNEAGYLYAPAACRAPTMSPERFIYLERVSPDWFVYKTT